MSTKRVVWLHSNRRVFAFGASVLVAILTVGLLTAIRADPLWLRWGAALVAVGVGLLLAIMLWLLACPRLAFEDHKLLVFLRFGPPLRVPIDVVECFFLGQGPTLLPRPFAKPNAVDETSTIVVRLAESAQEWKHLEVRPALGLWCDGYITIRGTWCEPINPELMKALNDRLVQAHREFRNKEVQPTA